MHRYLAEFDFRHNNRAGLGVNDVERTERAIRGIVGKRLDLSNDLSAGSMKAKTKAKSKPAPESRKRKADDPEQYKRFLEAAHELETDDSPEAFDRAFGKIVPAKPASQKRDS